MYEYKVVPAPLRTVKVKGLKTTADRFAHLLGETLNAEADGWEYLRTEVLPCEERKGLTGTARTMQTVLIFRRPRPGTAARPAEHRPHADAAPAPWRESPPLRGEGGEAPIPFRQEPVFRPGAVLRGEGGERMQPTLRTTPVPGRNDDPDKAR